jgi:light-regulated signal transduction histidine kinase (bacteriophytochrome)
VPLRAIIGFATLLVEEHAASLDGEGHRLLNVVSSRAGELSRMIDDCLRLSGLSQVGLRFNELDMGRFAREASATVSSESRSCS